MSVMHPIRYARTVGVDCSPWNDTSTSTVLSPSEDQNWATQTSRVQSPKCEHTHHAV